MLNGIISVLCDLRQNDVEKSSCLELSQILEGATRRAMLYKLDFDIKFEKTKVKLRPTTIEGNPPRPLIPQDFQILDSQREEARCDFLAHKICFTDLGPKQLEPMLSRNVCSSSGLMRCGSCRS
jgi:hypothetical protein